MANKYYNTMVATGAAVVLGYTSMSFHFVNNCKLGNPFYSSDRSNWQVSLVQRTMISILHFSFASFSYSIS